MCGLCEPQYGQTLSERMKSVEADWSTTMGEGGYTVVRVDGKAFHTYTKGFLRPFDYQFMKAMDAAAEALMKEISGSILAYTQSDEITVVSSDLAKDNTQPWFGGKQQKIVSVSAAIASVTLTRELPYKPPALFDARAFFLEEEQDVALNLIWRQRDAIRNSVQSMAQSLYTHGELKGKNISEQKEMILAKGKSWEDLNNYYKNGRLTFRHPHNKFIEAIGEYREVNEIVTVPAPVFEDSPWLDTLLGVEDSQFGTLL